MLDAGRWGIRQICLTFESRQARRAGLMRVAFGTVLSSSMSKQLLVVLTTGPSDGGRKAAIAFGVALAALAHGDDVHVFLSLESAIFGTPSGASDLKPRGFSEPLEQ